jgi:hypothetical protein
VAQSNQVQLQGILTAGPAAPGYGSGTLSEILPVSFCDTYQVIKNNVRTINAANGSPLAIPLEGIVKCRIIALRILAGLTVQVTLTTGAGVAVFNVSDQFLLRVRNPGDEVTAISIGTNSQDCDIALLLAGDIS